MAHLELMLVLTGDSMLTLEAQIILQLSKTHRGQFTLTSRVVSLKVVSLGSSHISLFGSFSPSRCALTHTL